MTLAHILGGPLDALIELGLPVIVFAALWWWSTRGERKAKRTPPEAPKDNERR